MKSMHAESPISPLVSPAFPARKTLGLTGHILFLVTDPTRMKAQLQGARVSQTELESGAIALRDDVSTDEITPVAILSHFDGKLARYPYTGLKLGDQRPIGVNAVA